MGPDDSKFEQTGITVADEAPDPAELIRMKHPDLGGDEVSTTTREAFDRVWSAKGWLIVEDDGSPLALAVAPVVPAPKQSDPPVPPPSDPGAKS